MAGVVWIGGVHAPVWAQGHWAFSLAPQVQQSQWQETATHGATLLKESGWLYGTEAALAWRDERWTLMAVGARWQGQRRYEGQTQSGQNVETDVAVRMSSWGVDARFVTEQGVLFGAACRRRRQERQIESVPGVALGYAETWITQQCLLLVGVQRGDAAGVHAALGWAPWARTQLSLTFPTYDPSSVQVPHQSVVRLEGGLRGHLANKWEWSVDVSAERRQTDRSDWVVLRRQGLARGALAQPATREHLLSLAGVVRVPF